MSEQSTPRRSVREILEGIKSNYFAGSLAHDLANEALAATESPWVKRPSDGWAAGVLPKDRDWLVYFTKSDDDPERGPYLAQYGGSSLNLVTRFTVVPRYVDAPVPDAEEGGNEPR